MSIYHDQIMDHYRHPRNFHCDHEFDANAISDLHNPSCGDKIQMKLQVRDGSIVNVCFDGFGCALSTASASMLTEWAKNKTTEEVLQLTGDFVVSLLDITVSPARMKCATLPLEALQEALKKVQSP